MMHVIQRVWGTPATPFWPSSSSKPITGSFNNTNVNNTIDNETIKNYYATPPEPPSLRILPQEATVLAKLPNPTSELPRLPLEVWTEIMSTLIADHPLHLPQIWASCRQVSHVVKAATEAAFVQTQFRQKHKTMLGFFPGCENGNGEEIPMRFDRLEDDDTFSGRGGGGGDGVRARAVFKPVLGSVGQMTMSDWDFVDEPSTGASSQSSRHLGDANIEVDTRGWRESPHVILVDGVRWVGNVELVGLQVDAARKEVSFLWVPTFSVFFAEQRRRRTRVRGRAAGMGRL